MLFHAGSETFSGGFVGVDVFFVISGYLITSIILAERSTGTFSMSSFYERRARRILPALFLMASACIPAAWIFLPPREMAEFSQSLIAVPPFLSNVLFWREAGYFDTSSELKPLIHTWSLAVEEQFYILYPLVLLAVWRIFERRVAAAVAVFTLAGLLVAEWAARHSPSAAFFLLPFRAWEIAAGALVALHLRPERMPRTGGWPFAIGAILGLALIGFAVLSFDRSTPLPGLHGLVPVIGALLTIVCARPDNLAGRMLASPVPVTIGLISYSAYLFHQPLMAFARYAFQPPALSMVLSVCVVLSLALAYLSWRYVERPFRDRTVVSRATLLAVTATVGTSLMTVGAAGHLTDGFLFQRLSPDRADSWRTIEVSPLRSQCHTGGADFRPPAQACEYFDGVLDTAVLGDSHAVELAYSLASALRPAGSKVLHLSFSRCAPTVGRQARPDELPCARWTEEALARIAREDSIRTVVVSFRINAHLTRPWLDAKGQAAVWDAYIATLRAIVRQGKQAILVLQAPELPKSVTALIFDARRTGSDIYGLDRQHWMDRTEFVRSRMAHIPPEVLVVDPTGLFCDQRRCFATRNGAALYFDDHHPSVTGADMVAEAVLRKMDEARPRH
jgi:peptidoglycan/LPS O-acetylase OafA/YrhL